MRVAPISLPDWRWLLLLFGADRIQHRYQQ
jgi:hypothetical protein